MAERINPEQLWQFSLAFYPKVKPVCILWQDELDANVNLMLLLCYLEQQQLSFSSTELQQLAAKLENFSAQFTRPLRQLRRSASEAGVDAAMQQQLKQSLLATELQLEQLEQQLLLQHCPPLLAQPAALLEPYLKLLNADMAAVTPPLIDLRQNLALLP